MLTSEGDAAIYSARTTSHEYSWGEMLLVLLLQLFAYKAKICWIYSFMFLYAHCDQHMIVFSVDNCTVLQVYGHICIAL